MNYVRSEAGKARRAMMVTYRSGTAGGPRHDVVESEMAVLPIGSRSLSHTKGTCYGEKGMGVMQGL